MQKVLRAILICLLVLTLPVSSFGQEEAKEDFNHQDWDEIQWQEEVAPKLQFFEMNGYFRMRANLFQNLDMDVNGKGKKIKLPNQQQEVDIKSMGLPEPAYNELDGRESDTLAGANLRLRLKPIINISEDMRVKSTLDILDNLVMGSTPEGRTMGFQVPVLALSQTQVQPEKGLNSVSDALVIKHVWGELMTPFGELKFGRMPFHFGLGIFANDGLDLDADGGTTVDRVMLTVKAMEHYFSLGWDFISEGATSAYLTSKGSANNYTQLDPAMDADQIDDINQFVFILAKKDKEDVIREKLANQQIVLNYGTVLALRVQARSVSDYKPQAGNSTLFAKDDHYGAKIYIPDFWVKFIWRKLYLEAEALGVMGEIQGLDGKDITISQWGGVARMHYKFLNDTLTFKLEFGIASGDDAPGMGINPGVDQNPQPGSLDGWQAPGNDKTINNFRFHTDYYVDMILFREILGGFSDAMYVKPTIKYELNEGFGAWLDVIFSRALYDTSTPGQEKELGLEFNLNIFYVSTDNFHAFLRYGLLVPFAGLRHLGNYQQPGQKDRCENGFSGFGDSENNATCGTYLEPSVVQSVQINFVMPF